MRMRSATLIAFGSALLVGFTLAGAVLYKSFIGLDPSAFPAGEAAQRLALRGNPDLHTTAAGGVLAGASLLLAGAVAFFAVRGARVASVDASRRRFLTGAGSGAGAALGGMLVAGAAGAARAFFCVGEGNRGWSDMAGRIMDRSVPFTNPEWKES